MKNRNIEMEIYLEKRARMEKTFKKANLFFFILIGSFGLLLFIYGLLMVKESMDYLEEVKRSLGK